MRQIIFVKYNATRAPEFRTCTTIAADNGKKIVSKRALTEEAGDHVAGFDLKYEKLCEVYPGICFIKPLPGSAEDERWFEFVNGEAFDQYILNCFKDAGVNGLYVAVEEKMRQLFSVNEKYLSVFCLTDKYKAVFGETDWPGEKAVSYGNLDMIFENIILRENDCCCIDYEWVFDFPVPIVFLKYRMLHYLFDKNRERLEQQVSEEAFCDHYGIDEKIREKCVLMEENFQNYVFGGNRKYRYLDRYQVDGEIAMEQIKEFKNDISDMDLELKERNYRIEKLNEQIREQKEELEQKCREIEMKDQHIIDLESLVPPAQMWMRVRMMLPVRGMRWAKRKLKAVRDRLRKKYEKFTVPQFQSPKVSIIIPVYNQFDYTYQCIKSIVDNVTDCSYEIILGDDVSTDRTKKIGKIISGLVICRNKENLRFLLNCNHAAEMAKGEYILFLNNDTTVNSKFLSSLVDLIESDETIGMVGSKLVYPDGRLQEAGGIIWKDGSGWNYGRNMDSYQPEYNYVKEVDYISGASIMIRRSLWEEIGGFDKRFVPAYCEDSDLAFQVRQHGYKVMYQPLSVVVHYEGVSNGTDLSTGIKKYQVENNKKFYEKWKNVLETQYENEQSLFKARERNYGKKTILVIDHYVPMFDKDAGSKTTFEYLQMFIKQGYQVKFLGDNFASFEPYTTILEQMGVEVLYGVHYARHIFEWLDEHHKDIDYVYLNRPHISEKYIDYFKEHTDVKIIYYGHDLHFLRVQREAELLNDDSLQVEALWWKHKEMDIMNKADVSYFPSSIEADLVHQLAPEIKVKAITAYVFDQFMDKSVNRDFSGREGILFVGGFTHVPNVDAIKWFVKEVYPLIREECRIPFYIVGSNATDEVKKLAEDGIIFKGFVSEEELKELYQKCRIVVVPLRYGAGVKGKVVEALYQGTPLVTTSVGAEGIPGIEELVRIEDESERFAQAVVNLYNDRMSLEKMQEASLQFVREKFSMSAVWDIVKEDFS